MPLVAIVYGNNDCDCEFIGRNISDWTEVTDQELNRLRGYAYRHLIPNMSGNTPHIIVKPADMTTAVRDALDIIDTAIAKEEADRQKRKQEDQKRTALAQEKNAQKRRERDRAALEALVAKNPDMVKDLIKKNSLGV